MKAGSHSHFRRLLNVPLWHPVPNYSQVLLWGLVSSPSAVASQRSPDRRDISPPTFCPWMPVQALPPLCLQLTYDPREELITSLLRWLFFSFPKAVPPSVSVETEVPLRTLAWHFDYLPTSMLPPRGWAPLEPVSLGCLFSGHSQDCALFSEHVAVPVRIVVGLSPLMFHVDCACRVWHSAQRVLACSTNSLNTKPMSTNKAPE